ncbi:hypothetical protein PRZ48_007428 [Zasmidium cellare]|uniref:Uncharacterized protein n=1 Tax=Zasmidium cellare TaxID=395010 RepID=A0ABR0EJB2_ZASCE|nr:hypothetical protein PRZ48_007428 [Zasmidium cellare]
MSFQLNNYRASDAAVKAIAKKRLQQLGVAVANNQRRQHMALLQYKVFRAAIAKAQQTGDYQDIAKYVFLTDPAQRSKATAWMINKLRKAKAEANVSEAEDVSTPKEADVEQTTLNDTMTANENLNNDYDIMTPETPKPKKRGRPSKADLALRLEQQAVANSSSPVTTPTTIMPVQPKKRGRPSKIQKASASLPQSVPKRRGRPSKAMLLERSQRSKSEDLTGRDLCDTMATE